MARIVYVNGEFVPDTEAKISIFDRGFLFGDGVYEVASVLEGRLIDNQRHLDRLERSLKELDMRSPVPLQDIPALQKELVKKNNITEGMVYLQITRGATERDFNYTNDPEPTFVMFANSKAIIDSPVAETGLKVGIADDTRWARRDIKTVMLLAPSLIKTKGKAAGFDDMWMVQDGVVTEGTSNNAFIVTTDCKIVTRHLGNEILHGITRAAVVSIAAEMGLEIEERPFTVEEAQGAAEAFITSASAFVMPVVAIDGKTLSQGVPGPITQKLRARYIELALERADPA